MTRVTATEAARQFSDLLNRTHYRGESFELERNGQVVARLVPAKPVGRVKDLLQVIARRSGDDTFADDLESAQVEFNTIRGADGDPWER